MKKTLLIIAVPLMTFMTIWCAGLLWFSTTVTGTPQTPLSQTSDAIVVLTGGANRKEEGLNLFASGKAPVLFITGVHEGLSVEDLTKSWQDPPLPGCCIELGYEATNTHGNARETRTWAARKNIRSVRLVTSEYHMPRARLEFTLAAPQLEVYPHPVTSTAREKGTWIFLSYVIEEYHKTLATGLRHLFGIPAS